MSDPTYDEYYDRDNDKENIKDSNLVERVERLESIARAHFNLLNWLAVDDTWQSIWDDAIILNKEIEARDKAT